MRCRDPFVLGYLAGVLATVAKNALGLLWWNLGVVKKLPCLSMIAGVLEVILNTPGGYLLGVLTDLVTGGSLGMAIALVYRRTGASCWLAKGLIAGTLSWLVVVAIVLNLMLSGNSFPDRSVNFWITSFVDHAVYGLVLVYLARRWFFPINDNEAMG